MKNDSLQDTPAVQTQTSIIANMRQNIAAQNVAQNTATANNTIQTTQRTIDTTQNDVTQTSVTQATTTQNTAWQTHTNTPTTPQTPMQATAPQTFVTPPPYNPCADVTRPVLLAALVGSYLLAYLYVGSFLLWDYHTSGYWQLAFIVCFFAAGEALARALRPSTTTSLFWVICGVGIGIALALNTFFITARPYWLRWNDLYERDMILLYGAFLLHAIAAYWVVDRFGWRCTHTHGAWVLADACNALVLFPFRNFFLRLKLFWQGVYQCVQQKIGKKAEKKPIIITACVAILFLIFFSQTVQLLRASDAVFATFLDQFTLTYRFDFFTNWSDYWFQFLLSLPVGAYLFGLFAHCMPKKQTPTPLETELAPICKASVQLRVVSPYALTAILACFIALYLLYFGVQAEYYLSAFWGALPEHVTFSEYARQGFFELCKVMAFNFIILLVTAKVSVTPLRTCKVLRGAAYTLLGSSLLFALTALAKLALYINAYGFTALRLLSCWGICVLIVAVVLAIQTTAKAQPVVYKLIAFATATFTLLCLCSA